MNERRRVCANLLSDNGLSLSPMSEAEESALLNGVEYGRGGLGAVYVWAAGLSLTLFHSFALSLSTHLSYTMKSNNLYFKGDGAMNGDECGADPFVNSRYTITVSAVTRRGIAAKYRYFIK